MSEQTPPTRRSPGPVSLSLVAYRLLLLAYPAEFRREYAPHMAQVFQDCCQRAFRRSGLPGLAGWWAVALADWLKSTFEQHTQKGVRMSKPTFIRISGWALILGAISLALGATAAALTSEASSPYDALYRATDPLFQTLQAILFPSAVLLVTLGLAGLFARYGGESGRLGRGGLIVGILGGATCLFTMLVLATAGPANSELQWLVMVLSVGVLFGGLAVFGLAALRRRDTPLLPRRRYLPLAAGVSFPALVVFSLVYEQATGRALELNDLVSGLLFLLTSLALLGLGDVLRRNARQPALEIGD